MANCCSTAGAGVFCALVGSLLVVAAAGLALTSALPLEPRLVGKLKLELELELGVRLRLELGGSILASFVGFCCCSSLFAVLVSN